MTKISVPTEQTMQTAPAETVDNSDTRLVDIFFYGVYMDPALLHEKGITIRRPRPASIQHCCVMLRDKAILLRAPDDFAYGMLFQLTHAEIDLLYAHQSGYRAEAFLVDDGNSLIPAISMVHIDAPLDTPRNPVYAEKFLAILGELGLPVNHHR